MKFCLWGVCFSLVLWCSYVACKENYCATKFCSVRHIACSSSGILKNYSLTCMPGSRVVPMDRYQKLILTMFNNIRNKVAGGYFESSVKAARMAKMVWSKELEYFAKLNVMACRLKPIKCMSSSKFAYVGQNSDSFHYGSLVTSYTNYQIIRRLIDDWLSQIKHLDVDMVGYLPPKFKHEETSRVTIAISERNTHIGCSALRYSYEYYHHFLFTCAFATHNFVHKPLYKFSLTAGSACRKCDSQFKNLCDTSEVYDTYKFTPLVKLIDILEL